MIWRPRPRSLPPSITLPSRRWSRVFLSLTGLLAAALILWEHNAPTHPSGQQPQGSAANTSADIDRYHDRPFRVTRVVDGDTLDIAAPEGDNPNTRVRLWGVDTPELNRGGKGEAYYAREAADFAREHVELRTVHLVLSPRRTRDKYGRLLAYVFLERGGVMLNELLLEEGYAYADPRFPHHYRDQFRDAEQRARRQRAGLWNAVTTDKMPAWKQRYESAAIPVEER